MALPWQADFYDCQKERFEDPDGNEYFFMWWTAQRPDDVFPSGGTAQVRWVRELLKGAATENPDVEDRRFTQMQQQWSELKFVTVTNKGHFEEEP